MATGNAAAFTFAAAVHIYTWIGILPLTPPLLMALFIPILPLVLSIIVVENQAAMNKQLGQALSAGVPIWGRRIVQVVFAYFAVVFVSFLVYSRAGSLGFHNGQHVLERGQQIIRTLTETEYLAFRNWETRFFSAGAMSFYCIGGFYWWFPRKNVSLQLSAE